MINEKKIIEAAIQNADKYNPCRSTLDREEACRASFEDGVEWLRQAIWHDRREEPTREGNIVLMRTVAGKQIATIEDWIKNKKEVTAAALSEGVSQIDISRFFITEWAEKRHLDQWCYLDDLLPKGGDK